MNNTKKDINRLENYVLKNDVWIDDSLKNEWTKYLEWEKKMITKEQLIQEIEKSLNKNSSTWHKGVVEAAKDLINELEEYGTIDFSKKFTNEELFNGAQDASQYSRGGSALMYDDEIAKRFCTPKEYERVTKNGINRLDMKRPNEHVEWLDVQARGLYQAQQLIERSQEALLAKRSNAYDLSKINEAKSEVKSILSSLNGRTQTKTNNK